jgi:hypothetical protein
LPPFSLLDLKVFLSLASPSSKGILAGSSLSRSST